MSIEAEVVSSTPAILNPDTFMPEKIIIVKLKICPEHLQDKKTLEGEEAIEQEIGKAVVEANKKASS